MKKHRLSATGRTRLDEKLGQLPSPEVFASPKSGWIRAIRDCLGMTANDLGRRIGITGSTVGEMESNERAGTIRMSSLQRAAEAMDCTLVYAFIPNTTLEETVRQRAEWIVEKRHVRVKHTMVLEDQHVDMDPDWQYEVETCMRSGKLWKEP